MPKDIRQSPIWQAYLQKIGWQTVTVEENLVFTRTLLFGLKVAKMPRPKMPINLKLLKQSLSKTLFVKIEPDIQEIPNSEVEQCFQTDNCTKDSWPLLPTKTRRIDIAKNTEEVVNSFSKETRYTLRQAQKNNVQIKESEDIENFKELLKKSAKRKRIVSTAKEAGILFESAPKNRMLLGAYIDDNLVSGALFLWYDSVGYYMHAATTEDGNKNGAPTLIIKSAIELLKQKGVTVLDFEGIEDKRYKITRSWQGFTRFKEGFGGYEVTYPQSVTYHRNHFTKLLFSLFDWIQ